MPFARDLHPEFGYIGSAPKLFRKLGLASAFVVFGAVAGVIGVTVFMTDPDSDPMHAMALAPTEPLINASGTPPAPANTNRTASEQEIINAGPIRSPCSDDISERLGNDCTPRAHKSHAEQTLNERPAIGSLSSHRTVRNAAEQLGTICGRFRDATTGYVRIGDGCRVWLWRRRG